MRFNIKVRLASTGVSALQLDAASPDEALQKAEAQGFTAFSVEAVNDTGFNLPSWLRHRESRGFSLLQFSQQLLYSCTCLSLSLQAIFNNETTNHFHV